MNLWRFFERDYLEFCRENHIDTIKIVDITSPVLEENRGYSYAILLIKDLPKGYIDKLNREEETDYTVFVNNETVTDELAESVYLDVDILIFIQVVEIVVKMHIEIMHLL